MIPYSFKRWFVHWFVPSFVRLFVRPSVRSFIRPFVPFRSRSSSVSFHFISFIHSFIHSLSSVIAFLKTWVFSQCSGVCPCATDKRGIYTTVKMSKRLTTEWRLEGKCDQLSLEGLQHWLAHCWLRELVRQHDCFREITVLWKPANDVWIWR